MMPLSMTLKLPRATPPSEWSESFLQGMIDRMGMSFFKYGRVDKAYPDNVNAISSLRDRLAEYRRTGNTEFLMDVANFAMIEFMCPAHPDAHFEAQDSASSPGRKTTSGTVTPKSNEELTNAW